jgi:hypothetical protein
VMIKIGPELPRSEGLQQNVEVGLPYLVLAILRLSLGDVRNCIINGK